MSRSRYPTRATFRGRPFFSAGHKKGAEVVKEIAKAAHEKGVKYLTLYAFSTENWNRPKDEVDTLMGLLRQYLKSDFSELHKNNIRIRFIFLKNFFVNFIALRQV